MDEKPGGRIWLHCMDLCSLLLTFDSLARLRYIRLGWSVCVVRLHFEDGRASSCLSFYAAYQNARYRSCDARCSCAKVDAIPDTDVKRRE